ncbi:2-aminoethylphosphonate ABC transporter permease subunit [Rhizobium rhizogenes]|uniref:2-aminoethylphosphonate ABC transporter permease subunit n=1 Tax=Rhizobium rhizogenes TaxID=359 RepID=UPI001574554A|nr:2-aminoethylphosphonate ABC transporter permease subunit [Rhizobium rhizogenes]NTF44589.1 2-aminoethylphosphonate ABC transporter permease subunit [Rhizobium rhizogenes]
MADVAAATLAPKPRWDRFWTVPPLLVLAVLFFYPLALIIRQSLGDPGTVSLAAFAEVLSSREFLDGLQHTIVIALGSTAGCLVLGFIFSLVIAFVPFPGAKFCGRLIDTFIALPTFLVTLAFTFIYGSAGLVNESLMRLMHVDLPPLDFLYSQWGVILAETTVYTPFVMRPLLATFSQIDQAQIEVASSLGAKPWRIVRQVILPAAMPALIAGGSLCLLLTVNEFGIVLFIGAKGVITLPVLVYAKAIQEFDYTTACVIAVVNVVLSLGLYSLYRAMIAHFGGNRAGVV